MPQDDTEVRETKKEHDNVQGSLETGLTVQDNAKRGRDGDVTFCERAPRLREKKLTTQSPTFSLFSLRSLGTLAAQKMQEPKRRRHAQMPHHTNADEDDFEKVNGGLGATRAFRRPRSQQCAERNDQG